MSTVTKAVLANVVYLEINCSRALASVLVDKFFWHLSSKVLSNDKILLSSFGRLNRKRKAPRIGRNPQTGEAMTMEARTVVTFSPAGNLRRAVNGGPTGRVPSVETLYPGTVVGEVEAKMVARIILTAIKNASINGDRVKIRDFGVFSVREYPGYTGRNPKTGEKIQVGPKKLPFFKPGKELLRRANA